MNDRRRSLCEQLAAATTAVYLGDARASYPKAAVDLARELTKRPRCHHE